MSNNIQYLPFVIVSLIGSTAVITFYLAYVKYEHVTYLWPYISDSGTYPPESCIFGQALNIVALLIGFALYVKYLQVKEIYKKHHIDEKYKMNLITLIVGLLTSTGISIVANFQETNCLIFHWFGAILTFGGGALYQCLQTLQYVKISPVIGQREITMLRIVVSATAMLSFIIFFVAGVTSVRAFTGRSTKVWQQQIILGEDVTKWKKEDGGYQVHQISTISEWICAGTTMIYTILFYKEFKSITLNPVAVVLKAP